ncbi:MAG: PEP-CTERM sorting domain-containing protein [Planctomycetes bacterium]|nr:PEP-CTERM sorting domain-containing protein [Planctomycetota bacterium]
MRRILRLAECVFLLFAVTGSALASPPVMQVGGEPFFPIGWYCTGQSAEYGSKNIGGTRYINSDQEAAQEYAKDKAQGMNTVLFCYSNYFQPLAFTGYAMAGALANDLKIMVEIDRNAIRELPGYPLSLIDDQVNYIKGHAAYSTLLGYYLADEPELQGITPAQLQARYAQVKGLDPNHPISVVHAGENYLSAEPPAYTDILMTDTYVVLNGTAEFANPMWIVASRARDGEQAAEASGKPYHNVVQAQSYDGTFGLRSPTFAEQRYLSYSPIVQGARGLFYWMEDYTSEEYRNEVISPVVKEIQSLVPAIVSGLASISVIGSRDEDTTGHGIGDVSYLFCEDESAGYLIAVNNTPNALASVGFALLGEELEGFLGTGEDTNIPVLFEDSDVLLQRIVGYDTWTLTDSFAPFGVHVYLIPEPGALSLLVAGGLALIRRRR